MYIIIGIIRKGHITNNTNSKNIKTNLTESIRKSIRPLSELNLIDDFLFSTLMETHEYAEKLVKLIIKRTTGREINNFTIESQKTYNGTDKDKHSIRLDVLIKVSEDDTIREVYDIEPNTYYVKDIARRNRYYNALTDSKLLSSNEKYTNLPELITIWILSYDPFGEKRMIYTIKNIVTENPDIVYNDGITTIFLNAKGEIGGSEELRSLLEYLSSTNDNTAIDTELKDIQYMVHTIKGDENVSERYMGMQRMVYYEKQMSYEEGEKCGEERGIQIGENQAKEHIAEKLLELGVEPAIIKQAMEDKNN